MGRRFCADAVELGVIGIDVEAETVVVDDLTQWMHVNREKM